MLRVPGRPHGGKHGEMSSRTHDHDLEAHKQKRIECEEEKGWDKLQLCPLLIPLLS